MVAMARDARASFRLITVKTPCHVDWTTMTGSDAVRHCGSCRKNVYNLSAMTEADAEALLSSAEDHCIRYYHRPDGTIVSSSCGDARHKAPSAVAAGLAVTLGASAAFAGIHAAVDQPERAASATDDRVLVAMGMRLTIDVKPRHAPPVSDVVPSLAPSCADPWGCSQPAPTTPVLAPAAEAILVPEPLAAAEPATRRGVFVGLLGGLVALLLLTFAVVRRHLGSSHR